METRSVTPAKGIDDILADLPTTAHTFIVKLDVRRDSLQKQKKECRPLFRSPWSRKRLASADRQNAASSN
jgi:hypothetical protein